MSFSPATSPTITAHLDLLSLQLAGVSLYRRESQIECVLRLLEFPYLTPKTVVLTGAPASAKSRFLTSFVGLFHGQQLPVSTVACHPDRKEVAFSLVAQILSGFLETYSPERLEQRIGATLQLNPWLGWIFPRIPTASPPTIPPDDQRTLRHGLESMLMGLVRECPHLAIVHNIDYADAESLNLLLTLQERKRHGLRVLATTHNCPDAHIAPVLQPIVALGGVLFDLPVLSPADLFDYLEEMAVELAHEEIAEHLSASSHGYPLDIERTLRTWVLDGTLTREDDAWVYHAPDGDDAPTPRDDAALYERLAEAAMVTPTSLALLALLWGVPQSEAELIVECGRQLGHFLPVSADTPDLVDVADIDQEGYLQQFLSEEQQHTVDERIVDLMNNTVIREALPFRQPLPSNPAITEIEASAADAYLRASQHTLRALQQAQPPQMPSLLPGIQRWDLPPPLPVTDDIMEVLVRTIKALRLAGVQYRLYPQHCEPVVERTRQAMEALDVLFTLRSHLIITCDGTSVAFDGTQLTRSDVAFMERDYRRWMNESSLHAIGITSGIQYDELGRFLHALVNHEPKDGGIALLSKMAALNLQHVKLHTGFFSAPVLMEEIDEQAEALTHDNILAFLSTGITPDEAMARMEYLPSLEKLEEIPETTPAATTSHSFLITREDWTALPEKLDASPAHVRRLLMASVTQWFRPDLNDEPVTDLPADYDAVISTRFTQEIDEETVTDLLHFIRRRLSYLLLHKDWDAAIAYFRAITRRHQYESNSHVHHLLSELLTSVVSSEHFTTAFEELEDTPAMLATLRELVGMLGAVALRPLLHRLSVSGHSRERLALVQQLSSLCAGYQHLLVQELKLANPWYYYRNVLTILAAVGNEESLAAASEKIMHADPRVRAEAITTALALTHHDSSIASYLVRTLADTSPIVRARAASLARQCQNVRIRDLLIGLLTHDSFGKNEPEAVQIAACSSLGFFPDIEARDILLKVFTARFWSPFWRKPVMVRLAALQALEHHWQDTRVQEVARQAQRHRNPILRHAARQLWDAQQHLQAAPANTLLTK